MPRHTKFFARFFAFLVIALSLAIFSPLVHASTPIVVNSAADRGEANPGSGVCDTGVIMDDGSPECTLRAAIDAANTNAGADEIDFNITGSSAIQLTTSLPTVTDQVTIDGYSQPGARANTAISPNPFNGTLKVEIDGSQMGDDHLQCLDLNGAHGSTIQGLDIHSCAGNGVQVSNTNNLNIWGNYIGTDITGLQRRQNGRPSPDHVTGIGVDLFNVMHTTIGGTQPQQRNVISGNQYGEIVVESDYYGSNPNDPAESQYTTVQGNYFGLGADGVTVMPCGVKYSTGNSILVTHTAHDLYGGTAPGAGNVIAASMEYGISLRDGTYDATIQGNYIGTDYTGKKPALHGDWSGHIVSGVSVATITSGRYHLAPHDILIGGTGLGARNIISGNRYESPLQATGINIHDGSPKNVRIQGNYVGLDVSGTVAIPNEGIGVIVDTGAGITVGGTTPGARNVLSGNGESGLYVHNTANAAILGNYIGTDAAGEVAVGNGGGLNAGDNTGFTVGNATAGSGNVISGNGLAMYFENINGASVQSNIIGLNANGTKPLPNQMGFVVTNSNNNTIGCRVNNCMNVISANVNAALAITGSSSGNAVFGNYIGLSSTGAATSQFANGMGIALVGGVSGNVIGGTDSARINHISTNNQAGVLLIDEPTYGAGPVNNAILMNRFQPNVSIGIDHLVDTDGTYANFNYAGPTLVSQPGMFGFTTPPTVTSSNFTQQSSTTGKVTISYDFNPTEARNAGGYRLEFYANDKNNNKGRIMIGTVNVPANYTGGTVEFAFPKGLNLRYVTATATPILSSTAFGQTSEFSSARQVAAVPLSW